MIYTFLGVISVIFVISVQCGRGLVKLVCPAVAMITCAVLVLLLDFLPSMNSCSPCFLECISLHVHPFRGLCSEVSRDFECCSS